MFRFNTDDNAFIGVRGVLNFLAIAYAYCTSISYCLHEAVTI